MKRFFTSESVTEGHPDKVCDLISDSVLDACLCQDKFSRVACEVMVGKEKVFVTGEITSTANINVEAIVRETLKKVGYTTNESGINPDTCEVIVNLSKQSADIAMGIDQSLEAKQKKQEEFSEGAGDQGMMFGFACDETPNNMPMPIYYAHKLTKKLSEVRKNKEIEGLLPDGKAQVTIEYEEITQDENGKPVLMEKPVRVDTIVLSTQHEEWKHLEELRTELFEKVIQKVIPTEYLDEHTKYYINPTGRFVIGGPAGDSGLTGRKIIVDTYGGYARHGGGAFSGKDPTKVDRSAAYMARWIAKNLVMNGFAKKCEIQLSYAIGVETPVSIRIDTFGTSRYTEAELIQMVKEKFSLTPTKIIEQLKLREPIYTQTTNYGHFGKDELPWEKKVLWEHCEK